MVPPFILGYSPVLLSARLKATWSELLYTYVVQTVQKLTIFSSDAWYIGTKPSPFLEFFYFIFYIYYYLMELADIGCLKM